MFWALLSLAVFIWLVAIYFIAKGLIVTADENGGGAAIKRSNELSKLQIPTLPQPQVPPATEETGEEEIEIPIGAPPSKPGLDEKRPQKFTGQSDLEEFYREFGRSNIVEFPAEYIDNNNIKSFSGNAISIEKFAKNCYSEIGFRCMDSVITSESGGRRYRVNIFDLICDHYISTDEDYVSYFGRLREEFTSEIDSINVNPDIMAKNRKALVGIYDSLPQLTVWNREELFLVLVKSEFDTITRGERNFLKEFIIEKHLFKAKIFRVIHKSAKKEPEKTTGPLIKPREMTEERIKDAGRLFGRDDKEAVWEETKRAKRRSFTKEDIKFLKENKDKLTNEEIAERLGRSVDSVTHKLSRLGIARESYEWTDDKDGFLRNYINSFSYKELARRLGTTIPSVRARCKKMDIKR